MKRDAKYLIAYLLPASTLLAVSVGGYFALSTVLLGFVLLPVLEEIIPKSIRNFSEKEETHRLNTRFFDLLLYLNVPILYSILGLFFYKLGQNAYDSGWEIAGITLSCGIMAGTTGINVAHELGHRRNRFERWLAKALLLPSLYMHFIIEHNLGHHKHVATDHDPASSRYNESLYRFWWRSVIGSYRGAWDIQTALLRREDAAFWSLKNEMLGFQVMQLLYLFLIGICFGPLALLCAVLVAIGGFLNLETVNYIEHYGLRRRRTDAGRYEPVRPCHSWNSNHEVGRIFLYELTRHSDHHFKATRKYQVLRHFDESPQLRFGYPGSMLMALVPPLWFRVMNDRLENYRARHSVAQ